jgi:DNA polymerase III delta subunit
MTYSDIKGHLLNGTVPNFLIFCGEEREVQRIYINKIAESKKQILKRIDGVGEALKNQGTSLFSQSFCYVCTEDTEFQKAESAWDTIRESIGSNTLIYQISKIDKRSKFYGYFSESILMFDYMTEQVLTKHIKERSELSTNACKLLIEVCEYDYSRILSELGKIEAYVNVKGMKWDTAFFELLNGGAIYRPPTDAIFDWVNAVLSGKPQQAFKLYEECKRLGEPSLRLLLVLYQGVKRLLQVQSCEVSNIAENTGLTQWEINLVKDFVGIYQTRELVEALRNIRDLEVGIKTGQIEEEVSVPCAMINLIRQ